ncbi:ATP-binding protein [Thermoproteota archaeon]
MNPCPCGFFTDPMRNCRCGSTKIEKYLSKISGPLLDRIDIHIDVPALKYKDISKAAAGELSCDIRERTKKARLIQEARFADDQIFFNAHMNHKKIKQYCTLEDGAEQLLAQAMEELRLSARAFDKIIKVSRTIADLDSKETIQPHHIAEAIQYRSLDRQLWI